MAEPIEPRLHLGAYALCLDDRARLLLARMRTGPDQGRWTMPGGGVEPLEHPDATVVRELEEETGLTCAVLGPVLGVYSHVYERGALRPWGPVHHIGLVYEVADTRGDLVHEADGSTDRCAWFSREEASSVPLVPLGSYGASLAWG